MWSILPFIKHIVTTMIIKGKSLRSSPSISVRVQMHKLLITNSSRDIFISISTTKQIACKPHSLFPDKVASFLVPLYVKK